MNSKWSEEVGDVDMQLRKLMNEWSLSERWKLNHALGTYLVEQESSKQQLPTHQTEQMTGTASWVFKSIFENQKSNNIWTNFSYFFR